MKLSLKMALAILSMGIGRADMNSIETLYRAIVSQSGGRVPTRMDLLLPVTGDDALREASPQQIEALLPLAAACLESSNPVVREDGMLLISTVAVARPDNIALLAPYVEKIASFLTDPDIGMRGSAIMTLAYGHPKPAPVALQYLARHLTDEQNSSDQFVAISAALLMGSPSDPGTVRTVLATLKGRPDHELLTGTFIQELGRQRITTPDALEFIRAGLGGKSAPVRLTALETIGRMPKDVRDRFAADLQRLLSNSYELPEIHAKAAQVLVQ